MVELLINKVIGEDWWEKYTGVQEEISANYVRDQLKAFPENEKELRILIDSPGGDVFEGVTIFNIIRDFARNNPSVKITTYIQGMAASMASAIALAANAVSDSNKVIAEDNSIFMIHDAWGYVVGNENDMREAAEYFAMIDSMLRSIYMRKTGKSEDDIRSMMDAETWLWGKNILEAGFVDEIIDSENNADESANMNDSLISARAEFKRSRELVNSMNLKRGGEALKRDWAAAKALAAQAQDQSVPDVNPPKDDKNADKKAMNEAFAMSLNNRGDDDGDN